MNARFGKRKSGWPVVLACVAVTAGIVLLFCVAWGYRQHLVDKESRHAAQSVMALRFAGNYTSSFFQNATGTLDAISGLLWRLPLEGLPCRADAEKAIFANPTAFFESERQVYDTCMAFYKAFSPGSSTSHSPHAFESLSVGTEDGGYIEAPRTEMAGTCDPRQLPWYEAAVNAGGAPVLTGPHLSGTGTLTCSMAKAMADEGGTLRGVVAIHINLRELFRTLETMLAAIPGVFVLADGDGVVLYHGRDPQALFLHVSQLNSPAMAEIVEWKGGFRVWDGEGKALMASGVVTAEGWHIIKEVERRQLLAGAWRPFLPLICWAVLLIVLAAGILVQRRRALRQNMKSTRTSASLELDRV